MSKPPPEPVYMMRGDMGPVHSLFFRLSADLEHLYAGTESGKVHIWDMKRNRELFRLEGSGEPCMAVHLIDDDRCLVTQRKGGKIDFWTADTSSWLLDKTVTTDYYGYCRCRRSSKGEIYIPLGESRIGLFSRKTMTTELELNPVTEKDKNPYGQIMAIKAYSDESELVLAAYDGGQLCLWDVRAKKVLSTLQMEQCPMCVDFEATSRRGLVGSPSSDMQVFSMSSSNVLSEEKKVPQKNPGVSSVCIRPDAKVFASGGWDGRVRINSWKSMRPLAVLDQHKASIHEVVYSSSKVEAYGCENLLAVAGKDGMISLWNLYN